jgi:hypothetical protein
VLSEIRLRPIDDPFRAPAALPFEQKSFNAGRPDREDWCVTNGNFAVGDR